MEKEFISKGNEAKSANEIKECTTFVVVRHNLESSRPYKIWHRNSRSRYLALEIAFYFLITYGVCKKRKYCNRMSEKKKFSPFDKCSCFV